MSTSVSTNAVNTTANARRPGLGLPIDYYEQQDRLSNSLNGVYFPNALNPNDLGGSRATMSLLTLREIAMLQIIQQITSKPDWNIKVFNDEIAARWKSEAMSIPQSDVSCHMMDYVIAELKHKAKEFKYTSYFTVYDLITISDTALDAHFMQELNDAVKILEDVPEKLKDWHPGSNGTILDLVHPSLFPLVYGKTRALEIGETVSLAEAVSLCGKGNVIPMVPGESICRKTTYGCDKSFNAYSRKFQWLPCEVDISGRYSKITSYINNLHPSKNKDLYSLIEKAMDASIPLWESTLSLISEQSHWKPRRVSFDGAYFNEDVGGMIISEPTAYEPPKRDIHMKLREEYGSKGLQVIVKLVDVELTPEKPEYAGGSWHVEGQLNEHICATSVYHYSNENITPSSLNFRQQVNTASAGEIEYAQYCDDWHPLVYGASNGDAGVQVLGGINTIQGRLLTFPNILQHQVQPFKLADPTKKGHRKILALFLVDPAIKVISTANVPCQRLDWWADEMMGNVPSGLDKLPAELKDEVFKEVEGFPISMDEAKELRLELMEERKRFQVRQDSVFHDVEFSLCEH